MLPQDLIYSLLLSFALSAFCGIRLSVPFMMISLSQVLGASTDEAFLVLNSPVILGVLCGLVLIETFCFAYAPLARWHHALFIPLSVICASCISADSLQHADLWFQWSLALVCGGGAAVLMADLRSHLVFDWEKRLSLTKQNLLQTLIAIVLCAFALVLPFVSACAVLLMLLYMLATLGSRLRRIF